MYLPLPTPEEMALWDSKTIESFGIEGRILMENASRECLQVLRSTLGDLSGRTAVVFAGSGNNGGDAFALARHLSDEGVKLLVLHTRHQDEYRGESAYHLQLTRRRKVPLVYLPDYNLDFLTQPDIIVDGLLGTGFNGELRSEYQDWIKHINRMADHSFVLAVDIPSGLNGRTGRPCPIAVKADATVTFEEAKLGLLMPEALPYVGKLNIRRIGIPGNIQAHNPPGHYALTPSVLDLLPFRDPLMHKGTAGHLLIVGGSRGLTGAPTLAALGGLRAGVGLATIACPGGLAAEIKSGWPEIMTLPLGDGAVWSDDLAASIKPELARFDAVVLGPGLGREPSAGRFCSAFLGLDLPPTVLDADGLYWLAKDETLKNKLRPQDMITPHLGEMARLSGAPIDTIEADRFASAERMRDQLDCVVVLKGAGTVITAPGQPGYLCPVACPNLAVGGAGDVLSGVLGSLLARGLSPLHAAHVGVYWHAAAGLHLQNTYPRGGNLAREIADALPPALKETLHD